MDEAGRRTVVEERKVVGRAMQVLERKPPPPVAVAAPAAAAWKVRGSRAVTGALTDMPQLRFREQGAGMEQEGAVASLGTRDPPQAASPDSKPLLPPSALMKLLLLMPLMARVVWAC